MQRRFRRYPSTMDAVARCGGHLRVLAGVSQCKPDPFPTQPDGAVSPRTAMEATPGTPPPPSVALVRSRLRGGRLGCRAALILSTAPPQPRWAKPGGTGLPSSFAQPRLRPGPADRVTTRVALDDVGWPASVDRRGVQPGLPASLPHRWGASVGCFRWMPWCPFFLATFTSILFPVDTRLESSEGVVHNSRPGLAPNFIVQ